MRSARSAMSIRSRPSMIARAASSTWRGRARDLGPICCRARRARATSRRAAVAVVGCARRGEGDMHFGDRVWRPKRRSRAPASRQGRQSTRPTRRGRYAERVRPGEQPLDQVVRPQAEGEARQGRQAPPARGPPRVNRQPARSPAFCAASTSCSARRSAAASGSNRIMLRANDAAGQRERGRRRRRRGRRGGRRRGRRGRSLMPGGPRSGIAARGRAGSAARLAALATRADGSAGSASRCRLRGGRSRRPRRSTRVGGQFAGEDGGLGRRRRKTGRRSFRPLSGTPMIGGSVSSPVPDSASRVARMAASAMTSISRAGNLRPARSRLEVSARRIASSRSWLL